MHFTIHDTPGVIHFMRLLSWLVLKLCGWKVVNVAPATGSYLIIAAPHTSNWDFPLGIAIAFHLRLKVYFIAKHTLFNGFAGPIMRWLGGVPLNRSASTNFVDASVEIYANSENLIFAIAPEGTRSSVGRWKTGFYHMAKGANVPLALAYFDFSKRVGGIGKMLNTTENIDADMQAIADFYEPIMGKYPNNFNPDITGTKKTV
ncbi:lysophospholipid acyltransferase family protein [Candidatus Njordibacter sp. Uisw_056]|jgi:1-acyl-sn-glycerol-3-phosphate acyltransferase|uniref:lysophospholipid acyltransferase family protein n=1 Tax=Candidatus Njordibacter sp. Uisw_056 TaxID=3230973 RepID=UPI003D49A47D|tara:strand:+ start:3584 stop:4192 length:609 start_codon:yes stop_codon:yes gene_type:complete